MSSYFGCARATYISFSLYMHQRLPSPDKLFISCLLAISWVSDIGIHCLRNWSNNSDILPLWDVITLTKEQKVLISYPHVHLYRFCLTINVLDFIHLQWPISWSKFSKSSQFLWLLSLYDWPSSRWMAALQRKCVNIYQYWHTESQTRVKGGVKG